MKQITEESIALLAVPRQEIIDRIARDLDVKPSQVSAVDGLVNEGCTVPFIARYRKEKTGSLDEVQVREISRRVVSYTNLETRRNETIRGIFSQGKLDEELLGNLRKCSTLSELEDIYAPFKKKKKTRGMIAREKGLEPLAEIMRTQGEASVLSRAPEFVHVDEENAELSVSSPQEALQGAMDILADSVAQDPDNRAVVKSLYVRSGRVVVKGIGDDEKKAQSVYQMYWSYSEPLSTLRAHRVLAINRGEREGALEVKIEVDEEAACALLRARIEPKNRFHGEAIDDGLRRLLSPAVLREVRVDAGSSADEHGRSVFSENLKNLLMSPPLSGTRVLGMDPGIRTGTKCAAMDETGKLLGHFVFNQERDPEGAKKAITAAVEKYMVQLIAVGNGTASQQVQAVVAQAIAESSRDVKFTVVDEDGASVYSASDVAREEFPDLDLTVRGAISIGRRLQDPLAELVKIDPKSIGVGLYQHDLNQKKLSESLDEVVESVVNRVGVSINTASASLLKYVSGVNATLSRKIVQFREESGKILSRDQLRKIPGMGPKTFEQCAGFLKIPESPNPLDNTWVHPENYTLAAEILPMVKSGASLSDEKRADLQSRFGVGTTTLTDIISELAKPNRDPREEYPKPILQQGVLAFEDLSEGMRVTGKVKNVVDFGAFVDIGIKETGLLHISEMSTRFIEDPMELLKVGDVKEFRIIGLDVTRRRISLSLKPPASPTQEKSEAPAGSETPRPPRAQKPRKSPGGKPEPGGHGDGTVYNPFADLLRKKEE
ncbi:MAG: helix-hairpin-helix domain-containing protein [Spirochaetia bacterium]